MKFMHISDVHLGVRPDEGRPWSDQRARDIWDSFAGVIETAKREKPEFLFLSGDLFHAQPLKKQLLEVNSLFGRIPDTNIVLMAGNHDYLRPKSYYLTMEWHKNVYFFRSEELSRFDFAEQNVCVYGMSYWHREIAERRYDSLIPENPQRLNILLAHGGDERHIPFSPAGILENGFDYVAAGHIHKGAQLIPGRAVMAGSLEPTDKNDTGPHGFWMGELKKGGAGLRFYPIKKCEYCHETYPVTGETSERDILDWAERLLTERPDYQYFRLFLKGKRNPNISYDVSRLMQLARVVDVTCALAPDYDYERLLEEHRDSLLGSYIRSMRNRPQDAVTEKALEYGVNALLGHEICR